MNSDSTITITFGDMAENHVGMEQIGELGEAGSGFTYDDLCEIKEYSESQGFNISLHDLNELGDAPDESDKAYLLIFHEGAKCLLEYYGQYTMEDLYAEQMAMPVDKHAYMYGRVVNKKARWNLCFDEESIEPDYENKKGRIVGKSDIPVLNELYEIIENQIGEKASNLKGEGNYYYDPSRCGIGFHGDSERRKVIGVRIGQTMPLCYQWYHNRERIGTKITFNIDGGDIYIMSEKAVGNDWKKRLIPTLRHSAGSDSFTA
jgi:hypothetical protein